jgi:hypothetical protein
VIDHRIRQVLERLRWIFLTAAIAIVIIFLIAQRQSTDVTYGHSPATATIAEGSAGELTGATLPSVAQMTAMVAANRVVRLPGAIAQWDTADVESAIGNSDVRILVAPPGLTKAQTDQIYDVQNATIRIIGTRVAGGAAEVTSSTASERRAQFGRNDITSLMVVLIMSLGDHSSASSDDNDIDGGWRAPTAAELATVADGLRANGSFVAPGATLTAVPHKASTQAFGTDTALYVALPAPPPKGPAPDYGPKLAGLFPDTPIVVMTGSWIEYYGPHAEDFADIASASFYARFGDRLSAYAYGQDNVLNAYLSEVTDIRYAGIFDRPLPYQPMDPVRVALPVLPWLFAACVAAFLALSARSLLRPATAARSRLTATRRSGIPARLAGLTALAVEVSGLSDARTNPALTRAISKLQAAREAVDKDLPDRNVRILLDDAESELDSVGRGLDFAGYRPESYLQGRLA